METKYPTAYGEMTVAELIKYAEMWRAMMAKNIEARRKYNQTEEGKVRNRERAKDYYQRHRQEVLQKRKVKREAEKDKPMFLD